MAHVGYCQPINSPTANVWRFCAKIMQRQDWEAQLRRLNFQTVYHFLQVSPLSIPRALPRRRPSSSAMLIAPYSNWYLSGPGKAVG